jgi:hypothetical protein
MQGTILLNYNENVHHVEEEEKTRFLRNILEQMGLPIQEFWADDSLLNIEQKIKLRNLMTTYSIQVIDDRDGHLAILVEGELVGEWHKCTYKLRRDPGQLDRRKQLYLEMEVNCWSLFEEQTQE